MITLHRAQRRRRGRPLSIAQRGHRRVAHAVAFLLLTAGLTACGTGPSATVPAASHTPPTWALPTDAVPVPSGSVLVGHHTTHFSSPIEVTSAAPDPDQLSWTAAGTDLSVSWRNGPALPNTLGRTDAQGYRISALAQVTLPAGTLAETTAVTVGSHPATLTSGVWTDPDLTGIPANSWLTWRLAEGRFVQVWKRDAGPGQLMAFANTLVERDSPLPVVAEANVTLPDFDREVLFYEHDAAGSTGSAGVQLCPSSTRLTVGTAGQPAETTGAECLQIGALFGDAAQVARLAAWGTLGGTMTPTRIGELHSYRGRAYVQRTETCALTVSSPIPLSPDDLLLALSTFSTDPTIVR